MSIYKLEDRVLFDAAAAADAAVAEAQVQEAQDAQQEQQDQQAAENDDSNVNDALNEIMQDDYLPIDADSDDSNAELHDYIDAFLAESNKPYSLNQNPKVIIISDALENADQLYAEATKSGTLAIIYDADNTSTQQLIQQINDALGDNKASSIAIAVEGDSNGNVDIIQGEGDSAFWKGITDFVQPDGRIDFLGSNLADSNYVDAVAKLTGLDVAASDDVTGVGGDWILEDGNVDVNDLYFDGLAPEDVSFSIHEAAQAKELVIINSTVADAGEIIDDLDSGVEVLILEKNDVSGIDQINDYLDNHDGKYETIRIISHGDEGFFTLNGEVINSKYLEIHKADFEALGEHLTEDGDLMIYGCSLAGNSEGQDLVDMLADVTGADVAASTNDTGNGEGADWNLEYTSGLVTADAITVQGYEENLDGAIILKDNSEASLRNAINNSYTEIYYELTNTGAGWNVVTITSTINITGNVTISGNLVGLSDKVHFHSTASGQYMFNVTNNSGDSFSLMLCKVYGVDGASDIYGIKVAAGAEAAISAADVYFFGNVVVYNEGKFISTNTDFFHNKGPQVILNKGEYIGGNTDFYFNTISGSSSDPLGVVVNVGTNFNLNGGSAYNNNCSASSGFLVMKYDNSTGETFFWSNYEVHDNVGSMGGALNFHVRNQTLVMKNCNLHTNTATSLGGGIFTIGGKVSMENCQVTNNIASFNTESSGMWAGGDIHIFGTFNGDNNNMKFGGDLTSGGSSTKTFNNSDVLFDSDYSQTVAALNYHSLAFKGTGLKTFENGDVVVEQEIKITEATNLKGSGSTTVRVVKPYENGTADASTYRVFNIDVAADVVVNISNMTIKGGDISGYGPSDNAYGGSIFMNNGTVNLDNVLITGSRGFNGGGIYMKAGTLDITDSQITYCSSSVGGGGIVQLAGIMNINGASSEISNNRSGWGGGINAGGGSLTISDATIRDNHASKSGSGLFLKGNTTISNAKILSNTASSGTVDGGGIFAFGNTVKIENGTEISGNNGRDGAGIYLGDNTVLLIADSILIENNTSTGTAAGIYVTETSTVNFQHVSGATGAKIHNGIYSLGTINADADVVNDFSDMTFEYAGGAKDIAGLNYHNLRLSGSDVKTLNTSISISGNFVIIGTASFNHTSGVVTFNGTSQQAIAGGTYHSLVFAEAGDKSIQGNLDVKGNFTTSSFTGNFIHNGNSVTYSGVNQQVAGLGYADLIFSNTGDKTLTGTVSVSGNFSVEGNASLDHGSQMFIYNGDGAQQVAGETYYHFKFSGQGNKTLTESIVVEGNLTVENFTGEFVHANHSVTFSGSGEQQIAALNYHSLILSGAGSTKTFADGTTTVMTNINITEAMTLSGSSASAVTVQVLHPYQNDILNATKSRLFTVNANGQNVEFNNMTMRGGVSANGGTLNVVAGNVTLDSVVIADSGAYHNGGGIYNSGNLTIIDSTIRDCKVLEADSEEGGGGIYSSGTLNISNSTINDNTVVTIHTNGSRGGGIYIHSGTATLQNVTIYHNMLEGYGGGVFNLGTMYMYNCTVTENLAGKQSFPDSHNGSGLANGGTATVNNSIIARNPLRYAQSGYSDYVIYASGTLTGDYNVSGSGGLGDHMISWGDSDALFVMGGDGKALLADNGGKTKTIALAIGSVAAGAGNLGLAGVPTTDQRGFYRGGALSIGAYQGANFKTQTAGAWSVASNWLMQTGVNSWTTATIAPDAAEGVITVNHNMTISGETSASELTISAGITLTIDSGATLTIYNETGVDVTVTGNIVNNGTVNGDDVDFVYNGGDQNILSLNYNSLALSGEGSTKTFSGTTSVKQHISITQGKIGRAHV